MSYVVYALCDPDEIYKVCYIGISQDVYNRFHQHLRDTDNNSLKAKWLKSLRDKNRVPYCKVLEDHLSKEDADIREAYWIHFFKNLHMPLTNADIPRPPEDEHIPSQHSYRESILELWDDGLSGRAIEKTLKKQRVTYRFIVKTLEMYRPGWNKQNTRAADRNICVGNAADMQSE